MTKLQTCQLSCQLRDFVIFFIALTGCYRPDGAAFHASTASSAGVCIQLRPGYTAGIKAKLNSVGFTNVLTAAAGNALHGQTGLANHGSAPPRQVVMTPKNRLWAGLNAATTKRTLSSLKVELGKVEPPCKGQHSRFTGLNTGSAAGTSVNKTRVVH